MHGFILYCQYTIRRCVDVSRKVLYSKRKAFRTVPRKIETHLVFREMIFPTLSFLGFSRPACIEGFSFKREHNGAQSAFFCWKIHYFPRVIGYHRPSGESPDAAWADTPDRHVGNASRAGRYAARWPASDESGARPHLVCADPDSSGNTIGTSLADRPDISNLLLARPTEAAMRSRQNN